MSSSVESAAARPMIYVGMDVHKESITIAVLPAEAKTPTRLDRLPHDLPKLKRWVARVARDGEIRACYEASGAGYVPYVTEPFCLVGSFADPVGAQGAVARRTSVIQSSTTTTF